VGDVHGCAAELAQLLADAEASRVVLVGDLFTKGPDPVGVWRLIQDRGLSAVLGNHDVRLLELGAGDEDERTHRTRVLLDEEDPAWRDWLSARPLHMEVAGYTVVHAGVHPS
jgi:bis(5'-nucleosyl)-tetraphosphatase (symmetrical)